MSDKQRIIDLQKSLRVARTALEAIKNGHRMGRSSESIAEEALDQLFPLERTQQLQGLLGHKKRKGGYFNGR